MLTEDVIKEAACNLHRKGTLEFPLEKDPALPITADVVRAASCSPAAKEMIELFLNVRSCMSSDQQPKRKYGAVSCSGPPSCLYDESLPLMAEKGEMSH